MHELPADIISRLPTDRRALLAGLGGLAAGTFLSTGRAEAGTLNPPGAPAPTPGPEPRIAINALNTPGNANSSFRINRPGSYYLEGNITGEIDKTGIVIAASDVMIDLMGFSLIGGAGSFRGIETEGERDRLAVRNGTLTQWGGGAVWLTFGGFGVDHVVENLITSGNGGIGIQCGDMSFIRGCVARANSQGGISTRFHGFVADCLVGFGGNGIVVGAESVITGCSVLRTSGSGIAVTSDCMVTNCSATWNSHDGIVGLSNCTIRDNCATGNGAGANGSGISVFGSNNIIEGNKCMVNYRGIRANTSDNFIMRNTCRDNTINWEIAGGNKCLVVSGVSAGAIFGNSGGV
jgi:hypothetical protein